MKILNNFRSGFLLLRYARLVGASKPEQIGALLEARRLNPELILILTFLGDAYHQAGRNQEAKKVIEEALGRTPNDRQLNRLMVNVLHDGGATTEEMIPYIKVTLRNRDGNGIKFPWVMGMFRKCREEFKHLDEYDKKWEEWAEKVLFDYENRS